MTEPISIKRLREMADPGWRYVGPAYKQACRELELLRVLLAAVENQIPPTECKHGEEGWLCGCCESDYKWGIREAVRGYREQFGEGA